MLSQQSDVTLLPSEESPTEPISWFAVWTRSRHEASVLKQLQKKGLEAFLPTSTKWSRWKDRKKLIDFPLFPGYCFVRTKTRSMTVVRKCTGVVSIVSTEGKPAPIPD